MHTCLPSALSVSLAHSPSPRPLPRYALSVSPHLALLQRPFYDTQMKPLLADWAMEWLRLQPEFTRDIGTAIWEVRDKATKEAQNVARAAASGEGGIPAMPVNLRTQSVAPPARSNAALRSQSTMPLPRNKRNKVKKNGRARGDSASGVVGGAPLVNRSISSEQGGFGAGTRIEGRSVTAAPSSGKGSGKGAKALRALTALGTFKAAGKRNKNKRQSDGGQKVDDKKLPTGVHEVRAWVQQRILAFIIGGDNRASAEGRTLIAKHFGAESTKLLVLTREWLTSFLPHTMSKVHRVSYGILHQDDITRWTRAMEAVEAGKEDGGEAPQMPVSRKLLAVPFAGKDVPSRSSEFAQPDILIGLTVLAYRYEGLRETDVASLVISLKKDLAFEAGPFKERPSWIRFQDWLDLAEAQRQRAATLAGLRRPRKADEIQPLELLQTTDESQMAAVYAALKAVPEVILYYLEGHVFQRVLRQHKVKLQANGVDLGGDMLFGQRYGFSGTPSDLLPLSLKPCHYEEGSEADIMRVLCAPRVVTPRILRRWNVEKLITFVATSAAPAFNALIDTGALVTGYSNEQVARRLLKEGLEGMSAVVYLDAEDRKMVISRGKDDPMPLNRCGIPLDSRFTYYDQQHTTGMDIKQPLDAVAVVTIGKDMTFRDYAQGAYRMRQVGKGQSLHLILVDETLELVRKEGGVDDNNAKTFEARVVTATEGGAFAVEVGGGEGEEGGEKEQKGGGESKTMGSEADVAAGVEAAKDGFLQHRVVQWLLNNSVDSEQLQHLQLCNQSLEDAWRQRAFRDLLKSSSVASAANGGEDDPLLSDRFHEAGSVKSGDAAAKAVKKFEEEVKAESEDAGGGRAGGGSAEDRPPRSVEEALKRFADTLGEEQAHMLPLVQNILTETCSGNGGDVAAGYVYVREVLEGMGVDLSKKKKEEKEEVGETKEGEAEKKKKDGDAGEDDANIEGVVAGSTADVAGEKKKLDRTSGAWLTRCIRIFRESLDHDISDPRVEGLRLRFQEQKGGQKGQKGAGGGGACPAKFRPCATVADKMRAQSEDFRDFWDDGEAEETGEEKGEVKQSGDGRVLVTALSSKAIVEEVLREADGDQPRGRGAGGETDGEKELSFDNEMVAEQQKEQQKEKQRQVEKQDQVRYAKYPRGATAWPVSALDTPVAGVGGAGGSSTTSFYPLRKFRLSSTKDGGGRLPFPDSLLQSSNYAPLVHRSDLPRRLKNVTVLMQWASPSLSPENGANVFNVCADVGAPAGATKLDRLLDLFDRLPCMMTSKVVKEVLLQLSSPTGNKGGSKGRGGKGGMSTADALKELTSVADQIGAAARRVVKDVLLTPYPAGVKLWGCNLCDTNNPPEATACISCEEKKEEVADAAAIAANAATAGEGGGESKDGAAAVGAEVDVWERIARDLSLTIDANDVSTILSIFFDLAATGVGEDSLEPLRRMGDSKEGDDAKTALTHRVLDVTRRATAHMVACVDLGSDADLAKQLSSYCVIVSLAEAETLRRVAYQRRAAVVPGAGSIGLMTAKGEWITQRPDPLVVSGGDGPEGADDAEGGGEGGEEKDQAPPSPTAEEEEEAMMTARQCARFYDCDLWFSDEEVILLLRALCFAAESERRTFFEASMGSRRRERASWDGTAVEPVFRHHDERHLLALRHTTQRIRTAFIGQYKSLREAFRSYDVNNDGWISSSAMETALLALDVGGQGGGGELLTKADVTDLLHHADSNSDGFLNYREFAAQFSDTSQQDAVQVEEEDEDGEGGDEPLPAPSMVPGSRNGNRGKGGSLLSNLAAMASVIRLGGGGPSQGAGAGRGKGSSSNAKKEGKNYLAQHLSVRRPQDVGQLFLAAGGSATIDPGDNMVSTRSGQRPTIAPRGVLLSKGVYYYEVTVRSAGRAVLGWVDSQYSGASARAMGIGDDEHSWGFDGGSASPQLRWGGRSVEWGFRWSAGDVVGCLADVEAGRISYVG